MSTTTKNILLSFEFLLLFVRSLTAIKWAPVIVAVKLKISFFYIRRNSSGKNNIKTNFNYGHFEFYSREVNVIFSRLGIM